MISENIKGIANAFSLQMIDTDKNFTIKVEKITKEEFDEIKNQVPSFVGHEDTAHVLGVECNRGFLTLKHGESVLVAQLTGGRLPEGATKLPNNMSIKFLLCTVKEEGDLQYITWKLKKVEEV